MPARPGTPTLLREINDRTALELLLSSGPLTRAELGERTGLSKVTASQLLARLESRGLVEVVGTRPGGRGPNASVYGVVPSCAYVTGLEIGPDSVTAGIADITGHIVSELTVDPNGSEEPARVVHEVVDKAARSADVPFSRIRAFAIGTPGMVDPRTGDVRFSFDLPRWHGGVLESLRRDLRRPVIIENDVNLAAIAERAGGAAAETNDFALLWLSVGLGLGVVIDGELYRGRSGAAGEIGWLPVPGAPMPATVATPRSGTLPTIGGAFQTLAGGETVLELAAESGYVARTPAEAVEMAVTAGDAAAPLLDELAGRLAVGVASICVLLDPGLVVLAGDVGRAGGEQLATRVQRHAAAMCPNPPTIAVSRVDDNPVLRGAVLAAVDRARADVFTPGRD
ncbi:ROK family transcriptional regulator [Haloechinothrix sp. YIM 98757]|uniref:ROK family transcriptional regulator n=1 Tax=Haloechinothrix aidingensis TaxID=2752311 RepID=A0A838AFP7_9PSEU|nr:ROK family transcriptional regulator [Haloechinothrix aidingensis]MBA0128031.1 ROK family transcriptional regulator [Haloechinothrix aidingensis]